MSAFPTHIGPYRVESEIGRGGMGVVYLATDPRLGRKVAIKALDESLTIDPERRARLAREARVLASLSHPNIAALFGVEEVGDAIYLVLELVEGHTLACVMAKERPSSADALRWCAQIASAVAAAHDAGILHRDLKPANIKVRPDGIVKVLDFGLASSPTPAVPRSAVSGSAPTATHASFNTRPGGVLGTPGYMSPEQARGLELDRRADVFAFGCILFECLTGQRAFAGTCVAELLAAVMRDEPPWGALPPDLPSGVRTMLERCLAKDRDQRLRDMGDAALELRSAGQGRSVTTSGSAGVPAPPIVLPRELTSFIGREQELARIRELLGATAVLTLTGAGGCGKTRLALRTASSLRESAPSGVWFVDLSAIEDESLVGAAAVRALNVPASEHPEHAPEVRVAMRIGDQSVLLLVDNAEHVLSGVRRLVAAVVERCPAARVLVTSREPLGLPYEQAYRVPSLELPAKGSSAEDVAASESGRLFIERARLADPLFVLRPADAPALADLCTRLDGIALAIELAAARTSAMSVRDIDARLGAALRVLGPPTTGPGTRHATIRAAIGWSVRLLTPVEAALFDQLAVFAGGWTLAQAEVVCLLSDERSGGGSEESRVDGALGRLVARSLVQFHGATGRYRFLETVRQLALERLESSPTARDVRLRHADHFLASAERSAEATPGSSSPSLSAIDEDIENIRAALRVLGESPECAGRFARLAFAMHKWWYVHGMFDEGLRALESAVVRLTGEPGKFEVRLQAAAGNLAWGAGRFDQARVAFERSLVMCERLGEYTLAAAMHSNIAIAHDRLGDSDAALREHQRAIAAYERAGDARGLAFARLNLSSYLIPRRLLDEAESALRLAIPVLRELDDQFRVGAALYNLGQVELFRGRHAAAESLLREALTCKAVVNDRGGVTRVLHDLGMCRARMGQASLGVSLMAYSLAAAGRNGVRFEALVEATRDEVLCEMRSALGDDQFQRAWQRGQSSGDWQTLAELRE